MQQGKGFREVGVACCLEERGPKQVPSMVALSLISYQGHMPKSLVVDPPEPARGTVPGFPTSISAKVVCGCQIWALESHCFSPVL